MARKKKDAEEKGSEYDILIGYVKSFNFVVPDDSHRLSGHPKEGRLYRLMKDPMGWRLHLGRETNNEGLDGLFLGGHDIYNSAVGTLIGEQPRYSFTVEVVTPQNYLNLTLEESDRQKLFEWIETDNSDLWTNLKKEQTGESAVIRSGMDLLKVLMEQRNIDAYKQSVAAHRPQSASAERERALEATLTFLTYFKGKPVDQLLALYDGMYSRILKTLEG